jgi:hypothetical protein
MTVEEMSQLTRLSGVGVSKPGRFLAKSGLSLFSKKVEHGSEHYIKAAV